MDQAQDVHSRDWTSSSVLVDVGLLFLVLADLLFQFLGCLELLIAHCVHTL